MGRHGHDGTASVRCPPGRVQRAPRLAEPLVDRPRLIDRLEAGRPLTVLRAPSGFGKTALLAQWTRTRAHPAGITAWLRAPASAEPAAFWTALADALRAAGLPGARRRRRPVEAQAAVEQTLDAADASVHLIVDRLDNLTDPRIDEQLLDMLRQTPALTLMISLRTHQRLPAHQLLDIDATVIPAAELLLTPDESAALADAIAPGLPAEMVDAVHRDCGGWPILTRAVLLAVAERPTAPVTDEIGTIVDGICAGYVWGRLLPDTTPADHVQFALQSALVDELTVNVAELLDAGSGKARLDRLVADGLLSMESRPGAQVYLWPAGARRVLNAELRRRHARRLPRLHGVLARHFADEDQPGPAIHHAVHARDWPLVVALIDATWRDLLAEHPDRLYDAVTAVPLPLIRTSRRAIAMRDVMLQLPAELMLSTDMLPRSERELDALARSADAAETLDTALAVLIALNACGRLEQAGEFALRVLRLARATRAAHAAQVAELYPNVLSRVGEALVYTDDPSAAIDPLREAWQHAVDRRLDYLAHESAGQLALVEAVLGEPRKATAWLGRRSSAAAPPGRRLRTSAEPVADTASLLVALDRLDLAEAGAHAARLINPVSIDRNWGLTAYALALLALHDGTADDALEQLRRAAAAHLEWRALGTIAAALLAAAEADLLLCLGRGQRARAALHGEHAEHRALRVGQARLALLTGDPAAALRMATDPHWEQGAATRHRREMLLIRAVAAHRTGDHDTALHALRRAAHAADATGALRPLVTVPRRDLDELAAHVPLARKLLAERPLAGHPGLFPDHVALITLTRREQIVLEKLAAGLNLHQTADALVVSYNTVRSQQASIYRKLGADSRQAAIARARESGLL